jgi:hypothetical protein
VEDSDGNVDEVRYKCDPGYVIKFPTHSEVFLPTTSWSRKCTKQGEWRDMNPACTSKSILIIRTGENRNSEFVLFTNFNF